LTAIATGATEVVIWQRVNCQIGQTLDCTSIGRT